MFACSNPMNTFAHSIFLVTMSVGCPRTPSKPRYTGWFSGVWTPACSAAFGVFSSKVAGVVTSVAVSGSAKVAGLTLGLKEPTAGFLYSEYVLTGLLCIRMFKVDLSGREVRKDNGVLLL